MSVANAAPIANMVRIKKAFQSKRFSNILKLNYSSSKVNFRFTLYFVISPPLTAAL